MLEIDGNYGQLSSSKSLYPLTDALGSTLALANATGAVTGRYSYDPYGASIASGGDSTDWQYTGRENDGTGLYYYRARYYNPTYGRFISEDPIGWDSGQTNLYGYVGGNPISFVDLKGLWSFSVSAYAGWGGGVIVGQNNATGEWFWGGRLGYGFGAGFGLDPLGKRPGADQLPSCNHGTTVGTFG